MKASGWLVQILYWNHFIYYIIYWAHTFATILIRDIEMPLYNFVQEISVVPWILKSFAWDIFIPKHVSVP